jgi:predicted nucleic acid-binding protein
VAKHLIDTDLHIDLIQSGTPHAFIRELYDREAPGIYFSSIAAQELLARARSLPDGSASKYCSAPSRESVES